MVHLGRLTDTPAIARRRKKCQKKDWKKHKKQCKAASGKPQGFTPLSHEAAEAALMRDYRARGASVEDIMQQFKGFAKMTNINGHNVLQTNFGGTSAGLPGAGFDDAPTVDPSVNRGSSADDAYLDGPNITQIIKSQGGPAAAQVHKNKRFRDGFPVDAKGEYNFLDNSANYPKSEHIKIGSAGWDAKQDELEAAGVNLDGLQMGDTWHFLPPEAVHFGLSAAEAAAFVRGHIAEGKKLCDSDEGLMPFSQREVEIFNDRLGRGWSHEGAYYAVDDYNYNSIPFEEKMANLQPAWMGGHFMYPVGTKVRVPPTQPTDMDRFSPRCPDDSFLDGTVVEHAPEEGPFGPNNEPKGGWREGGQYAYRVQLRGTGEMYYTRGDDMGYHMDYGWKDGTK